MQHLILEVCGPSAAIAVGNYLPWGAVSNHCQAFAIIRIVKRISLCYMFKRRRRMPCIKVSLNAALNATQNVSPNMRRNL